MRENWESFLAILYNRNIIFQRRDGRVEISQLNRRLKDSTGKKKPDLEKAGPLPVSLAFLMAAMSALSWLWALAVSLPAVNLPTVADH